jgi:hypothetical protein
MNGLPSIDGLSALPKNLTDVADRPSGLPENTHDDSGGFARLPKNLSGVVDRLSRLAANTHDNTGGLSVLPGNVPDGVDHFSGLPEKMPYNVDHSPRLHEDQPCIVDCLFALHCNAPDDRICRVAGSRRVGDMGEETEVRDGRFATANPCFGESDVGGRGTWLRLHTFYGFRPAKFSKKI